ncbi:MAG: hypothetical protein N2559_00275 [Anaerolineae bacterium]|nr:hypothetical protein [Anaerolineae bacterium]
MVESEHKIGERRIEKVVTKVPLRTRKNDFAYWQTRPYAERLAALQEIRRGYHRWKYGAEPRLQRTVTIIKIIDI